VLRGITRTTNRCGVLVYVSLAEHYARIVADEGIAEKVPAAEWQAAIDALTGHIGDGRIAPGFIAAIERCGNVLAAHAPPDGSPNSLPDRLYVV
jgi:putative membrane protein